MKENVTQYTDLGKDVGIRTLDAASAIVFVNHWTTVYVPITKLFYLLRSIHTLYECDEKITNAISIKYTQKYMNKSVKLQCNPSLQYLGPYTVLYWKLQHRKMLCLLHCIAYTVHILGKDRQRDIDSEWNVTRFEPETASTSAAWVANQLSAIFPSKKHK